MAKFAQVKEGQLVIDPFSGNGSLLIPQVYIKLYFPIWLKCESLRRIICRKQGKEKKKIK